MQNSAIRKGYQGLIQNQVKHLKLIFFTKIVNGWLDTLQKSCSILHFVLSFRDLGDIIRSAPCNDLHDRF